MNVFRSALLFYVFAMLVLCFIPAWHSFISQITAPLDQNLSLVIKLTADPLEYVWKWVLVILYVTAEPPELKASNEKYYSSLFIIHLAYSNLLVKSK